MKERNESVTTINILTNTLAERLTKYGEFEDNARVTQNLKRVMRASANWERLSDDKKESLEMIAHKISRILNGDPEYADSWHDICGYSSLVEDLLNKGKV